MRSECTLDFPFPSETQYISSEETIVTTPECLSRSNRKKRGYSVCSGPMFHPEFSLRNMTHMMSASSRENARSNVVQRGLSHCSPFGKLVLYLIGT
ncbi:hypothetical protein AVEN_207162-1 [Araneus ventricosus]|uniref:Uncharacterized protein n=1 Tax=Araneus ventricosus TaxID=182803 RepID=A0A4Y2HL62_ARAVE|nr:hypothetical protein AVEN_207162-1 [Araneus ventricosus]